MPRIEPVVFAQIMMLPPALREDLLECVGATNMEQRQVEDLLDKMRHDLGRRSELIGTAPDVKS